MLCFATPISFQLIGVFYFGKNAEFFMTTTKTLLVSTVFALNVCSTSFAATWDGGGSDNKFSTSANWEGDTAPASGSDIIFSGSARLDPFLDYQNFNCWNITFSSGGFTMGGESFCPRPGDHHQYDRIEHDRAEHNAGGVSVLQYLQ